MKDYIENRIYIRKNSGNLNDYDILDELYIKVKLREEYFISGLIDEINEDLLEYVDDITENIMGINDSHVGYNIINPNIPNTTDPKKILKVLAAKAEYLKSGMTAGRYAGIVNILDDFAQTMNRYIYLSSDR